MKLTYDFQMHHKRDHDDCGPAWTTTVLVDGVKFSNLPAKDRAVFDAARNFPSMTDVQRPLYRHK